MHNKFLMGVKFWRSWRNFQEFSKSHYYGDFFQKWSPNCFFESEWVFGPLIFFNLRYIKGGVRGNNSIGIKKCTTIFLWVWNFGEVGEIFKNFQKHPLGESFWKNGLQLNFLKAILEGMAEFQSLQNFRVDFFSNKIYRDFSLEIFFQRISLVFLKKNLKGFFFGKIL